MQSWISACTQLLISWWQKDRIRAARAEGKVMFVQKGDRLLIGEQLWIVQDRIEQSVDNRFAVQYQLVELATCGNNRCLLRCTITSGRLPYCNESNATSGFATLDLQKDATYVKLHQTIELVTGGLTRRMQPDEITFLPPSNEL